MDDIEDLEKRKQIAEEALRDAIDMFEDVLDGDLTIDELKGNICLGMAAQYALWLSENRPEKFKKFVAEEGAIKEFGPQKIFQSKEG